MRLTPYEQGFLSMCKAHGVSGRVAGAMSKIAQWEDGYGDEELDDGYDEGSYNARRKAWVEEQIRTNPDRYASLGKAKQLELLRRKFDMDERKRALKQYGKKEVLPDGTVRYTGHLYRDADGNYTDKPMFSIGEDGTIVPNSAGTAAPGAGPAVSAQPPRQPATTPSPDQNPAHTPMPPPSLPQTTEPAGFMSAGPGENVQGHPANPPYPPPTPNRFPGESDEYNAEYERQRQFVRDTTDKWKREWGFRPYPGEYGYEPEPAQPADAQRPPQTTPPSQPAAAQRAPMPPPQARQPQNRRESMWGGMDDKQKDSFRQWAQRDGRGKTFGAMFRGADGKVDREAYDRFIAENPSLLTGTDAERDAVLKKRYAQLDQGQKDSFHQSKEYMDYRAAALARRQKQQDAAMDNVQNQYGRMKSYDDRQRAIAADPYGATSMVSGGSSAKVVPGKPGFVDFGGDIDAINNAGRHVDSVKDFGVAYDHRTGKTYRIVNGKMQEMQGGSSPAGAPPTGGNPGARIGG